MRPLEKSFPVFPHCVKPGQKYPLLTALFPKLTRSSLTHLMGTNFSSHCLLYLFNYFPVILPVSQYFCTAFAVSMHCSVIRRPLDGNLTDWIPFPTNPCVLPTGRVWLFLEMGLWAQFNLSETPKKPAWSLMKNSNPGWTPTEERPIKSVISWAFRCQEKSPHWSDWQCGLPPLQFYKI